MLHYIRSSAYFPSSKEYSRANILRPSMQHVLQLVLQLVLGCCHNERGDNISVRKKLKVFELLTGCIIYYNHWIFTFRHFAGFFPFRRLPPRKREREQEMET